MEERSDIPQRLWEKGALRADAARCLEKTARSDISQYARVGSPAWALLLGRDLERLGLDG